MRKIEIGDNNELIIDGNKVVVKFNKITEEDLTKYYGIALEAEIIFTINDELNNNNIEKLNTEESLYLLNLIKNKT